MGRGHRSLLQLRLAPNPGLARSRTPALIANDDHQQFGRSVVLAEITVPHMHDRRYKRFGMLEWDVLSAGFRAEFRTNSVREAICAEA